MVTKMRNDSLIMTMVGVGILLIAAIFVFTLFSGTKKETIVQLKENKIELKGQYGAAYDMASISDIQLVDNMPAVTSKVNGAGLGEIKKGDFKVKGLGTCRLYVHSAEGPFIYLVSSEQYIIINFKDASKTKATFEELKNALELVKK